MKRALLLLGIVVVLLSGCQSEKITANGLTVKKYLEKIGYKVQAYKGEYHYTLNEQKLNVPGIKQVWEVQKTDPKQYLGKNIDVEFFVVTDHPLEKLGYDQVHVSVLVVDGKVVGGTSFPYDPEGGLGGHPYSLDGKTLEQLQGEK